MDNSYVFELGPEGELYTLSPKWEKLLDSPEDYSGQSWLSLVVPSQRSACEELWNNYLSDDTPSFIQTFHLLSHAESSPLTKIYLFRRTHGFSGVLVLQTKTDESYVFELESRLNAVYQNSTASIVILDKDHHVIDFNPAAALASKTRFFKDMSPGDNFIDYVHPSRLDDFYESFSQVLEGKTVHKVRNLRASDQRADAYQMTYSPIFDKAGTLQSVCFTALNIERQNQAELMLKKEQTFVSAILHNANALIFVFDKSGHIVRFNNACQRLMGYTLEELSNKPFWETLLCKEEARQDFYSAQKIETGYFPRELQSCWCSKSNIKHIIKWSNSVIYSTTGRVEFVVSVGVDRTEQEAMEKDLLERNQILQQMQKMDALGFMAGAVAHDFNNLLTGMQGHLELMTAKITSHQDALPHAHKLSSFIQQAHHLTKELLFFSRKTDLDGIQIVPVDSVIKGVESLLEKLLKKTTRLKLVLDSQQSLKIHPTHLHQILMNLVLNAQDASPREAQITISTSDFELKDTLNSPNFGEVQPGTFIEIGVRDQGQGIPEEVKSRLFEPFFTTKASTEGSGLGLTIVQDLLKLYQGFCEVETSDSGSHFKCFLPVYKKSPTSFAAPKDNMPVLSLGFWRLLDEEESWLEGFSPEEGYQAQILTSADEQVDILLTSLSAHPLMTEKHEYLPLSKYVLYISDFSEKELACIEHLNPHEDVIFRPLNLKEVKLRLKRLLQKHESQLTPRLSNI